MARRKKKRNRKDVGPPPPRNWRLMALGGAVLAAGLLAFVGALQFN